MISQTYPLSHPGSASSRARAAPPPNGHHVHVPTRRGPASHRDESAAQRSPSGPPAQDRVLAGRRLRDSEVERHGHEVGPPGQGLRAAPRWSTGGAGLSAHKHGSGQVHGVRCRTGAQAWGSGAGFRTAARCSASRCRTRGSGGGAQAQGSEQRRDARRAVQDSSTRGSGAGFRSAARCSARGAGLTARVRPQEQGSGWDSAGLEAPVQVRGAGLGSRLAPGPVDRRCRATASGNHCAIVLVRITACWGSTTRRLADRWSHTAPGDTGAGTGAEFARTFSPASVPREITSAHLHLRWL